MIEVVGAVVAGLGAGVLAGLFGVGGAVITTPAIRALGVSPIDAVGSTIPAILPAALTGAHRYSREGLVDWRVALTCGVAGATLAVAGAWVSDVVDARWLMVLTAGLLAWSGVGLLRRIEADGTATDLEEDDRGRPRPGVVQLAGVGASAGFVAGLLGVGGGVVMMPLFTQLLRLPVKVAVASSLVAVAIFSVPALISHTLLDHIDWPVALALVVGTVPGARLGARLAIGATDATMRRALGWFFCLIALVFGGRELSALVL